MVMMIVILIIIKMPIISMMISEWCDLSGMKLNASKTMIVFRSRTMHPQSMGMHLLVDLY